ncbi:oxidative damage protection protein [Candidatus Pantoea carbekii]|uniref:Probable Fe(2+)-trafficking protein n=1 Tax=Candidatus Pantoea carbekii TaxID=1235990 RepID=U3U975_9GAMM|nr:oxidative damage protection protein [Candidatus Pantoea carbekii]AKC32562.1 Fe(2+) trafficking protein YggX [Candidatus Pantoea carbekii]BAO00293.1 hypothetical protein HHS_03230 [Candidatus Pantoea carbekii]
MKRTIFCRYLQCNAEGQDFQIYPGQLGKRIYNEISKQAWKKWIVQQTILINERHLNMLHLEDQKFLEQEMINFLFKEETVYN